MDQPKVSRQFGDYTDEPSRSDTGEPSPCGVPTAAHRIGPLQNPRLHPEPPAEGKPCSTEGPRPREGIMNDTTITLIGNCTADPELRFTSSGTAVANFTVASTPRSYDRQTNEWVDQPALFIRCNVWRQDAENVAESLRRGDRVIVHGRLKQRSFETTNGETRTVIECDAFEVAASLKFRTAKLMRVSRERAANDDESMITRSEVYAGVATGTGSDDEPPF